MVAGTVVLVDVRVYACTRLIEANLDGKTIIKIKISGRNVP